MSSPLIDTLKDVRSRIESIPDEKYRMAFKYQYLIGGDAGEVSGKNAPRGIDASKHELQAGNSRYEAVLFKVKTVRRHNHYRACVLPLDPKYDPWVSEVYEYFKDGEENYPFRFMRKDGSGILGAATSKTYIMNMAKDIFKGLDWFKEGYTTTKKKQDRRRVDFTSSQLRDLRLAVLSELYGFNEVELACFGAWNLKSYNESINMRVEQRLSDRLEKEDTGAFIENGERYFSKLLIPYEDSTKLYRRFSVEDYKYQARFILAGQIILTLQKCNTWAEAKLDADFFRENMMVTYDIVNDCEDEYQFKTKITNLEKLFDVKLGPLRNLVTDPPENAGSIKLINTWLDEKGVSYDETMLTTWFYINRLRNNLLHVMVPREFMTILEYFDVEFKDPIDYSRLWENILVKFKESLDECFRILNEFR